MPEVLRLDSTWLPPQAVVGGGSGPPPKIPRRASESPGLTARRAIPDLSSRVRGLSALGSRPGHPYTWRQESLRGGHDGQIPCCRGSAHPRGAERRHRDGGDRECGGRDGGRPSRIHTHPDPHGAPLRRRRDRAHRRGRGPARAAARLARQRGRDPAAAAGRAALLRCGRPTACSGRTPTTRSSRSRRSRALPGTASSARPPGPGWPGRMSRHPLPAGDRVAGGEPGQAGHLLRPQRERSSASSTPRPAAEPGTTPRAGGPGRSPRPAGSASTGATTAGSPGRSARCTARTTSTAVTPCTA